MTRLKTVEDGLKASIASTLSDYRHVPKIGMNVEHITLWINQFPKNERIFVLEETDRLLKNGYFSKKDYRRVIRELAEDEENEEVFNKAAFLDIQDDGLSQNELLESLVSIYQGDINIVTRQSTKRCVSSFKQFVYFDDVCFSGRKACQDLTWLINKFDLRNIEILMYFLGGHTSASWNIQQEIKRVFHNRNISILIGDGEFRNVENRLRYNASSGVFWPIEQSVQIPNWVREPKKYIGTYRKGFLPGKDFPDELRRNRFESILTATGFEILSNSVTIKEGLKPLGFSPFRGVGFGGTTFTYRNCPNNVPLAFWWGNYERTGGPALSCWYPLMRRIVYNR